MFALSKNFIFWLAFTFLALSNCCCVSKLYQVLYVRIFIRSACCYCICMQCLWRRVSGHEWPQTTIAPKRVESRYSETFFPARIRQCNNDRHDRVDPNNVLLLSEVLLESLSCLTMRPNSFSSRRKLLHDKVSVKTPIVLFLRRQSVLGTVCSRCTWNRLQPRPSWHQTHRQVCWLHPSVQHWQSAGIWSALRLTNRATCLRKTCLRTPLLQATFAFSSRAFTILSTTRPNSAKNRFFHWRLITTTVAWAATALALELSVEATLFVKWVEDLRWRYRLCAWQWTLTSRFLLTGSTVRMRRELEPQWNISVC